MGTTTVPELIARAQAISDQEDNFVTRAQWLVWANLKKKELEVKAAQLGVPYHQYDETITLTGALEYTVSEPLAILGLYYVESDGRLRKLKYMDPVQARRIGNGTAGDPTRWWVRRNTDNDITILIQPVPTSGTLLLQCISYPKNLVYDTPSGDNEATVKYPLGWEEYIVLGMAERALAKEETVNPVLDRLIAECNAHIESSAGNYIMASVPTIRNVKEENEGMFDPWVWL